MAPSAPAKKATGPKRNVPKVVTAQVNPAKKTVLARKGVMVKKATPAKQVSFSHQLLKSLNLNI